MPQSITIAAFALGAVLLLIAILHGGGFKIFGAEVDGSPGRFGRVFAGVLGVILIGIGLVISMDKSLFQSAADAAKTASDVSQSGESTAPNTNDAQESRAVRLSRERLLSTNRILGSPLASLDMARRGGGRVPDFPAR